MPKPFMTYDQQLQKMRDKHLTIKIAANVNMAPQQI